MARSSKTGSATFTKPAAQPRPELNVTPLVDVVLVLLIIFMVVAPSLQEGTPVTLPDVRNVDDAALQNPIEVVMTSDGKLWLDDRETSREAVLASLESSRRARRDRPLLLKADAQIPYGTVRDLFASIQRTGFRNVSLKVAGKTEPGES